MDFFARRCETRCFFPGQISRFPFPSSSSKIRLKRCHFTRTPAETHKYGRCFLYSFVNVASSFAERAIGCIARAVSVPERVARVRLYLRVGRRPTDFFVALHCVIKINLPRIGFYGGRILGEEGLRCHFERLLCIEEYFVNAHRTSVASRLPSRGSSIPAWRFDFFFALSPVS